MRITLTEHIDAPRERVFEMSSDIGAAPDRISGIKKVEILTDGPIGKGTRFRETREMFGKEHTETLEFVAFDPPRSFGIDCESSGVLFVSRFTFESDGAGTRVTLDMRSKSLTMKARLMAPMMLLCRGAVKKAMRQDLAGIKRAAEHASEPAIA
ncbi:MAG: SRPBCC family protein [Phycisphaerales bacterium]